MNLVRYSYPSYRRLASLPGGSSRSPWSSLETEIDRLFAASQPVATSAGFPVDLFEDPNHVYVRAELPGVSRDDIQVEMTDGVLSITAVRKSTATPSVATNPAEGQTGQNASAAASAEPSVTLSRSLTLPAEISADQVNAAYENGVLTVTLPKREEAKPKKISVTVK